MGHHFHEWPWEGQESPQYVGQGPDLMPWRGTEVSLWALGKYMLAGTYQWYNRYCTWVQDLLQWYDRYCAWAQDLLYGSWAQVTSDGVIVGAQAISKNQEGSTPSVLPGAVVIGHSSEKPSGADAVLRWPSVFYGCSVVALCVLVVRRLDTRSAGQETVRRGTSTGEYWRLHPR